MEARLTKELKIASIPVGLLKPHVRNARVHSKQQLRQIARSIDAFGFTNPVLIDAENRIIAGHGRVEAAKILGISSVPTIRLDHLTTDQVRAYILADNKIAANAGWDESILAIELQHLLSLDCVDLDITLTGFEMPEIDLIIEKVNEENQVEEKLPEPKVEGEAVTRPNDLWRLGKHKILCGNALHESSYKALMGTRKAAAVFVDPPFNVKIDGHATGNGAIHHREFQMASGEMGETEFLLFLSRALRLLAAHSVVGSVHYVCMDWRHVGELLAAGKQNYDEFLNLCVWAKNSGGMGSFYRSQHELVFVFRKGKGPHRNNIQLGKFGRNRTNVWHYPGIQTQSKQSDEGNLLNIHPTVKPVALIADALLDSSARGDLVLDAFIGSGSALIAAERTGRTCYGMEIDPLYVDAAVTRWQRHTGDHAIHGITGKTFDETARDCEEAAHG